MRLLKLALLVELELGVVWTIMLVSASSGDAELGALLLSVPIYAVHLICMVIGGVSLWRRPETRALAAAVVCVPIMLLFLPAMVRIMAGGAIEVHPALWLLLPGLPLAACLLLPHHVSCFLPKWALRSRWLNVSTIILLSVMLMPWAGILAAGPLNGDAAMTIPAEIMDQSDEALDFIEALFAVFAFAILSFLVGGLTFLTSYVGLFQRVDRRQQKLRVAQLVLSTVLLVPTSLVVVVALCILAIALANPG